MRNIRVAGLALATVLAAGCASGPFGWGDNDVGLLDWDTDGNGLVEQEEFEGGVEKEGWFDDVDDDGNNMLSPAEFNSASAGWGLDPNAFSTWDSTGDGMLSENEFIDGLFETWDRNDDFVLDDNEFGLGIDWFD